MANSPVVATKDFAQIGIEYAQKVVSGEIWTGKYAKLACQRHLDDLTREKTEAFPYCFDRDLANRVCRFVELFRVFEGKFAGQQLTLQPWQCWFVTTLFGWVCYGGERDGKRRFRRSYKCVPRGQGKSALASALGMYCAFAENEGGAQVCCAGTSRDVAKVVFGAAQEIARREPAFMRSLGVEVLAHRIIQKHSASRMWAISADSKFSDGLAPHMAICDELHLHKDRRLYDSLESGLGKRVGSLMYAVTTAGTDISGICYELEMYLMKILDKQITDESTFGVIYSAPEGFADDITNPLVIQACNPGWGVTVMPEVVLQLANKAKAVPSAINNFKTKILCCWCSADQAWLDISRVRQQMDSSLKLEDYYGRDVYIGLDLATKTDLCAKTYLFPELGKDGKTHYTMFVKCYLPEAAITLGRSNSSYKGWEHSGYLTVHDGDIIELEDIQDDLIQDAQDFNVQAIAHDPLHATQMVQRLLNEGINCIDVRMNVMNLSEPMKELQALILDGCLHIEDNPITLWNFSNVTIHVDRNENIYPRKQKVENKIDIVVSAILALAVAINEEGELNSSLVCLG